MEPYKSPTATPLHLIFFCIGLLLPTFPLSATEEEPQEEEKAIEERSSARRAPIQTVEEADAVETLLQHNKTLKELASVPLLRKTINTIVQQQGIEHLASLTNLHALYHTLITTLWEEKAKKYPTDQRKYAEALLAYLAMHGMAQNQLTISSELIKKALATSPKKYSAERPKENNDLHLLYTNGLLNPTPQGQNAPITNTFVHPTFQAYYAAYYFARVNPAPLAKTLRQHKYNPRYQLVWCFYIGSLNNHPISIYQFMQKLGEEPRDLIGYPHTMLQARLLSEVQLPDRVMQRLVEKCELPHNFYSWLAYAFYKEGKEESPARRPLLKALNAAIASLPNAKLKTGLMNMTWFPKSKDEKKRRQVATKALTLLKAANPRTTDSPTPKSQVEKPGKKISTQPTKQNSLPALLKALQNQDSDVRYKATVALGNLGNPNALTALLHTLEDEDRRVRSGAARAITKLSNLKALPNLVEKLNNPDSNVRHNAALMLSNLRDGMHKPHSNPNMLDDKAWEVSTTPETPLGNPRAFNLLPHLVDALQSNDTHIRSEAAIALGNLQDPKALPALLSALKDKATEVRSYAAEALGEIGDKEALPHLLVALKDEEEEVREYATAALGKLHLDAKALPFLLHILKEGDKEVRRIAATALGQIRDDAALPPLMGLLQDENAWVRKAAATALGKLRNRVALPSLLEALKDKKAKVRSAVATALGEIGDVSAVNELIDALKDGDAAVRQKVAVALGQLGDKKALKPLLDTLNDTDSDVCQAALVALGKIGDRGALSPLLVALQDDNRDVRKAAAVALGEIEDGAALPALLGALKDEDEEVCEKAGEALRKLHLDEKALPILLAALKDEYTDEWGYKPVLEAAASALGQLGDSKARPSLLAALQNEHKYVARAVAYALGLLGDDVALPHLLKALKASDDNVREKAAIALGKLRHPESVHPLINALKDKEGRVRQAACKALGQFKIHEVPILREARHHKNPAIRLFAQVALQEAFFPYNEVKNPLLQALQDDDKNVRLYVIKVLERLGSAWTVIPLVQARQDSYIGWEGRKPVRKAAENALDKLSWEVKWAAMLPLIDTDYVQDYLKDSSIKQQTPLWVDQEEGTATTHLYFIETDKAVKKTSITVHQCTSLRNLHGSVVDANIRSP